MDKSAHLAYLAKLALNGFAVASVEYRTSNEGAYPMPLEDVKAAIRYLKAHADRYCLDVDHFGVAGESAGGYLAAMCALNNDKSLDVGNYLDYSSEVQACCPFYPPTDLSTFPYKSALEAGTSMESLMLGMNIVLNKEAAQKCCPVSFVTPSAPPFMIFHGTQDSTVPFSQSVVLHDLLVKNGCDATLVAVNGAEHADIFFAQEKLWDMVADFSRTHFINDIINKKSFQHFVIIQLKTFCFVF